MALQQTAGPESHRFSMELPNTPARARYARQQIVRFVEQFNVSRETACDIETAAGEAIANAVEHGLRPHGTLRIEVKIGACSFEAVISDDGPGFAQSSVVKGRPGVAAPRGYGLFLIRKLTDAVEIRDAGRTVWFKKML